MKFDLCERDEWGVIGGLAWRNGMAEGEKLKLALQVPSLWLVIASMLIISGTAIAIARLIAR